MSKIDNNDVVKAQYATTGGNGIAGFVKDVLNLPRKKVLKFTLQGGEPQLRGCFSRVERRLYDDSLAVTDTRDLIEYIRTLPWSEDLQVISDEELFSALEVCKQDGVIVIPKEYGMFVAYR